MNYNEKLQKIVEYMKSGEKVCDEYTIGFESEHFIVDRESLDTVLYLDKEGVRESMLAIENLGYKAAYEGDYILGLSSDVAGITIEPGSQFEVAIASGKSIDEIVGRYEKTMADLVPVFDLKNQLVLQTGYHPKTRINQIEFLPKKRYEYMSAYFAKYGGTMPFNMMKGSASLQVAIDYSNEADFAKKYFVANALSVFLYTSFDNSYIFEGKPYQKRNLRQTIWENCEKSRTGTYPFAFDKDLSYEKYGEKILDTDSIFIHKDGEDIYTGARKFADIFDEDSSDEMIYHALSIVFPDVRAKKYIEIRMPDSIPYPYNFAALALIKNIFYDREILEYLYDLFADMTYAKAQSLKEEASHKGLATSYKEKTINEWMLEIIGKIRQDRSYIDPLAELLEKGMTPRDLFASLYKENPQKAAYEFSVNNYLRKIHGQD